jgi:radical SAM superfamily enzyme YgiQ (UPF0313 family)
MNVGLHLVALPWSPVLRPSIVLGCLKAYIDKAFDYKVPCHTYSAFVEVLFDALGSDFIAFYSEKSAASWAEAISQFVYFEEFIKFEVNKNHRAHFAKKIRKYGKQFSIRTVKKLRSSLKNYINNRIVPNLRKDSVNIIGLTMTMQQSYFSAFVGKYLKVNYPEFDFVFLYGGASSSSVNVAKIFRAHNIPGFLVIGEGEEKLVNIIRSIKGSKIWDSDAEIQITKSVPGVLAISSRDLLFEMEKDFNKTQLDIQSLPEPDHQEYFDTLKRICRDSDTYNDLKNVARITLQGSRGCFSNCDFCSLNRVWRGFRQHAPQRIVKTALNQALKYNCNQIMFIDNSCDKWAEEYADQLIARNRRIVTSMELRVDHSEYFWTKLALSGVEQTQLGIESFSPPLLKSIGKGTTVVQNIVTQKYLKELNIKSRSNLITDHPKSTVNDAKYTKHVLMHLPHLDQYNCSYFLLTRGSPLYSRLPDSKKRRLKDLYVFKFRGLYQKHQISSDHFEVSHKWIRSKTSKAWKVFETWYEKWKRNLGKKPHRLDIIQCNSERLWVRRVSNDRTMNFKFNGRHAAVYSICHKGLHLEDICGQLNYSPSDVSDILREFLKEKLMIDIEGIYISLALRPRDELIKSYFESRLGNEFKEKRLPSEMAL